MIGLGDLNGYLIFAICLDLGDLERNNSLLSPDLFLFLPSELALVNGSSEDDSVSIFVSMATQPLCVGFSVFANFKLYYARYD